MKLRSKIIALAILLGLTTMGMANTNDDTLTFGTAATYAPFEYLQNNKYQGFDMDVANALCSRLNKECKFVNIDFDLLFTALNNQKIDAAISTISITAARQNIVSFSNSYYVTTASFVASQKVAQPYAAKNPLYLKGLRLGAVKNTTFQNYLQTNYGKNNSIVLYENEDAAFAALVKGNIDAVMADTAMAKNWLSNNKGYVIMGQPLSDVRYFGNGVGIAVAKGNTELLTQINGALTAMQKDGTFKDLRKKYNL
jgi:arginine transport system substrate-binding protein